MKTNVFQIKLVDSQIQQTGVVNKLCHYLLQVVVTKNLQDFKNQPNSQIKNTSKAVNEKKYHLQLQNSVEIAKGVSIYV